MVSPEQSPIDLRSYLKILSQRKWLIIATFLTVVISTMLVTFQLTPVYEAVAAVEVQPQSGGSGEASAALESVFDPTRGLQTQVGLIQRQAVLGLAAKQLELPGTQDLKGALSVELEPDTQIVNIKVQNERAAEAADWANAVANAYLTFRRERALENSRLASEAIVKDVNAAKARIADLEARIEANAGAAGPLRTERDATLTKLTALEARLQDLPDAEDLRRGGGSIIEEAVTPTDPVRPKKALNLALAIVVGAMLALGLAFLAENLDDRMKSPEEVEAVVGAPILGYVPMVKTWTEDRRPTLAVDSESASGAAEAYRNLVTNLRFVSVDKPLRTILVTSAVAAAGKSTTAANLAATLALSGDKVVLVSADLRRPSIHKFFGLTNSLGLLDAFDKSFRLEDALLEDEIKNLRILPTGGLPPNPTEILDSARFDEILTQVESLADVVVIDSAPVLGLGDAGVLASRVDGILFVVRSGGATRSEVAHASDQLNKAGGRIIGAVLNAVEAEDGYGYYYHYYYNQYSSSENGDVKAARGSKAKASPERSES